MRNLSDYDSKMYCTSNENGRQEIQLSRSVGFFEYIMLMIARRSTDVPTTATKTYEAAGTFWVDKKTQQKVDDETQFFLFEVKGHMKRVGNDLDYGSADYTS